MIHSSLGWAGLTLGLLVHAPARPTLPEGPRAGDAAPEFWASAWLNHVGEAPSLESLHGRAVLVEFWATWSGACRAAWPQLEELHEDHEAEGLVVLALSEEEAGELWGFVEEIGTSVRIGAQSRSAAAYGVTVVPTAVLIDPQGRIVWRGDPCDLPRRRIDQALAGARRPRRDEFLSFVPTLDEPRALGPALEAARAGRLSRSLSAARTLAGDPRASEDERAAALELAEEITDHAARLGRQAEAALARRDVATAVRIDEALAHELAREAAGLAARERRVRIEGDAALSAELAAWKAYERTRRAAARLSTSQARRMLEDFEQEHAGTRAAERSRARARPR